MQVFPLRTLKENDNWVEERLCCYEWIQHALPVTDRLKLELTESAWSTTAPWASHATGCTPERQASRVAKLMSFRGQVNSSLAYLRKFPRTGGQDMIRPSYQSHRAGEAQPARWSSE